MYSGDRVLGGGWIERSAAAQMMRKAAISTTHKLCVM
jgi:hypothetical protein